MPRPLLIVSQPVWLIKVTDTNSHFKWQTQQIRISWFLKSWIYNVCKNRAYPGSAGPGLNISFRILLCFLIYTSGFFFSLASFFVYVAVSRAKNKLPHLPRSYFIDTCKYTSLSNWLVKMLSGSTHKETILFGVRSQVKFCFKLSHRIMFILCFIEKSANIKDADQSVGNHMLV